MNIVKHAFWLLVGLGFLGNACSSGSENGESPLDRVEPYATKCTETTCSKERKDCEAHSRQLCDDCFDSCSSPLQSNPASCASICNSVCKSDCFSCSYSKDECVKQGVVFAQPRINQELALEAQRYVSACSPDWDPEVAAQFWGHSYRHEVIHVLRCELEHGCGAIAECPLEAWEITEGTVGTAICQRQQQCNSGCTAGEDVYVNYTEFRLRPALAAELWRCAGETDCAIATACWAALQPAVGIGSYPDAKP